MQSFLTLFYKEILRFWKVALQTLLAPIVTAFLYLPIFSYVGAHRADIYPSISYITFLVPGLAIMSMLQNAFANSSSSLIQSKLTGNLIFILLPPFSHIQFFLAYTLASVVRSMLIGLAFILASLLLTPLPLAHIGWIILFSFLSCFSLGAFGLIAGIWAGKFDQLATFQNFIIFPLTFLSGVFYSLPNLPPFWQSILIYNPIFYMVDGFRYGFLGYSDVNPWISLGAVTATIIFLTIFTLFLLKSGYKLRK